MVYFVHKFMLYHQTFITSLPFSKTHSVKLPGSNFVKAEKRLQYLQKHLQGMTYFAFSMSRKYRNTSTCVPSADYARDVPSADLVTSDPVWYLPHHSVYHPMTTNKAVFYCAAKYKGVSLNDAIKQGPDLVNSLVSVLTCFRMYSIAIVGDVEAMFQQVWVKKSDSNTLRFLWWPLGDLVTKPTVPQMLVHVFGTTYFPCCATFCMKHTAQDYGQEFPKHVSDIVKINFYVDDCLT